MSRLNVRPNGSLAIAEKAALIAIVHLEAPFAFSVFVQDAGFVHAASESVMFIEVTRGFVRLATLVALSDSKSGVHVLHVVAQPALVEGRVAALTTAIHLGGRFVLLKQMTLHFYEARVPFATVPTVKLQLFVANFAVDGLCAPDSRHYFVAAWTIQGYCPVDVCKGAQAMVKKISCS